MAISRLGLDGYGVRRAGSFSAKSIPRTRLSCDGYGARRCGSFEGKVPGTGVVEPVLVNLQIGPPLGQRFQHARLHPFEERDQYGRLSAAAALRVLLHAFVDADAYAPMLAHSVYSAVLASTQQDEIEATAMHSRRGLPNKELLALFMAELHKH